MPEPSATQTARPTTRALRVAPWLAALLLAGIAQFIRAVPVDGVIFLLVALVVAIDAVRPLSGRTRLVHATTIVTVVVGAGAATLLIIAPRHTIAEGVIVITLGVTAALFAWPDRPTGGRMVSAVALRRTAVLWAIVGLTIGLWELVSFVMGRVSPDQKYAHPAISDLLDPALDVFWGRALFIVGWLLLGLLLLGAQEAQLMRMFTIAVFLVCAGLVVLLALSGRRNALGIAPFGDLLDRIMAERATRLTIVLFWWWIGWHFLVVQTVDP